MQWKEKMKVNTKLSPLIQGDGLWVRFRQSFFFVCLVFLTSEYIDLGENKRRLKGRCER